MNMRHAADVLYRIASKDDDEPTMDPEEVMRIEEGQTPLEALGLVPEKDDEE